MNRGGDAGFISFIDDGPQGGTYQQEIWLQRANGTLQRLAYPGQALADRPEQSIDRIEGANQSYEPKTQSTQGGRARRIDDSGSIVFAGRLRKGSQWHNALFVVSAK